MSAAARPPEPGPLGPRDGEDRDAAELGAFGYAQQLRRGIGTFSSFAVSFSLISVCTGVFANFALGLRQVGPAVPWSWCIVLAGQLLVALVLAELASRMPLSGYGYQWSSRLVGPRFGFFVGWLLVLQFLAGFPGVCATLASHAGAWQGGSWNDPRAVKALTLAVIAAVALLHLAGMRWAALLNDLGVWTELLGVAALAALLIALAVARGAPADMLLASRNAASALPAAPGAWALSLLLGAWCLTGFEAAADLAEETRNPRRVVPQAILASLVASGAAGFALLVGLVLAIDDLPAVQAADNPLLAILADKLGPAGLAAALAVVGMSILACALASMAAASRLLFALGRDNMLPGAPWLAAVDARHGTPRNAILCVWAVSSTCVAALPQLDLITQISAVAGYLGYAGILGAALASPPPPTHAGFRLGAARSWIGGAALAWVAGVVLALTIPPTPVAGIATQHLPALSTAAAVAVGIAVYALAIRPRLLQGTAGPPPRPIGDGAAAVGDLPGEEIA
jgi:amino acid transporter